MATAVASISSFQSRTKSRTALVASADRSFRQRLNSILSGLRWQVREATGGAEAWGEVMEAQPQTMIIDSWLPDLDLREFLREFSASFPQVEVVTAGNISAENAPPGPHRQEILYALRQAQDCDTASWNIAPNLGEPAAKNHLKMSDACAAANDQAGVEQRYSTLPNAGSPTPDREPGGSDPRQPVKKLQAYTERIPELVGNSPCMLEISRRIRKVAPRTTPVLIEGPTGSGKELVAEALHRLSERSKKPFVAINCAAIPEALLEAELFGHTRGAFTGAVQGRVGRIEAGDGGTLFLDEIGEMPLGLQAKLLRFVESGELQRIGDNETVKVDVRIIAATHQPLAQRAQSGSFRADLYYRLAVFLIRTPSLADHLEDLPLLVEHFLDQMGREMPVKRINEPAMERLKSHAWPGNVRELEHVLERASILAGDEPVLTPDEIDFGAVLD